MEFPNTNGAWVAAPGNPLVEIQSDGTGVNVKSRPAGGRSLSDLTQGERLAFQYQHERFFHGEAAAAGLKAELAAFSTLTTVQTPGGEVKAAGWTQQQVDYANMVNAQREKDRAAAEAALASGSYVTPAPPPPPVNNTNDAPPANPVNTVTTPAHTATADGRALAGAGAGEPMLALVGMVLLVGGAWYFLRGGSS